MVVCGNHAELVILGDGFSEVIETLAEVLAGNSAVFFVVELHKGFVDLLCACSFVHLVDLFLLHGSI